MITARNLGATLSSLGADVESVLLELVAESPTLDTLVRKELFRHCRLPKLTYIASKRATGYHFSDSHCTKAICAMHAIDQLTRFFDDEVIVDYLKTKCHDHMSSIQEMCQ